ncbi:Aristolochene synthase in complex with 12,13-Difluorofarnesyl diphosphate [Daldinia bambusicola]|nr:Aristolochene synthase in complex with 12,13-Difluorofarnesyl diphosphate [Daldinia bambusicola]
MEYPQSTFSMLCHPRYEVVEREVNEYFIANWPFPDDNSRDKFLGAGFSRCTCLYFPTARDDRIHFACRLLTLLFLIDDALENMSFEEGAAYNGRLMPLIRGDEAPDRSVPVQYISYDLWQSMRAHDRELADAILEPLFIFMRAQTDKRRARSMSLGEYLEYRDKDIGQALLCSLMRFCLDIKLTPHELDLVQPADVNCGVHIAIINDIWSFEKEAATAAHAHDEGGVLCNGVAILSTEAALSTASSKRVLYSICREWEDKHKQFVNELGGGYDTTLGAYLQGLEYQMSGNEAWSKMTPRYQIREKGEVVSQH